MSLLPTEVGHEIYRVQISMDDSATMQVLDTSGDPLDLEEPIVPSDNSEHLGY